MSTVLPATLPELAQIETNIHTSFQTADELELTLTAMIRDGMACCIQGQVSEGTTTTSTTTTTTTAQMTAKRQGSDVVNSVDSGIESSDDDEQTTDAHSVKSKDSSIVSSDILRRQAESLLRTQTSSKSNSLTMQTAAILPSEMNQSMIQQSYGIAKMANILGMKLITYWRKKVMDLLKTVKNQQQLFMSLTRVIPSMPLSTNPLILHQQHHHQQQHPQPQPN